MDPMDETRAAFAVVGSLREPASRALRAALREESDAALASRISDAMRAAYSGNHRVMTFWAASGGDAILAVQELTGVSENAASMFVGAALHAQVIAGGDVNGQTVIALAERAAAWDRGRTFGEATAGVTA
jgi:hypothetical protein